MPRRRHSIEEMAAAKRTLKAMMAKYALFHEPKADARTLTFLHKNGVVKDIEMSAVDDVVLAALVDETHPTRVVTSPGPMLFYCVEEDKSKREGLPVTDLLFHPDTEVRRVALSHFQDIAGGNSEVMSLLGRSALEALGGALLSDDGNVWRDAAIKISDALEDNFLLNLAGMRQCHELGWGEGVRDRLRLLMNPPMRSLDAIAGQLMIGVTERVDEVKTAIDEFISSAKSIDQLCWSYYKKLGHLPLGGAMSFGRTVSRWLESAQKDGAVWNELWAWADEVNSPIARYHVCTVFLERPELVPDGKHSELWESIRDITEVEVDNPEERKWMLPWMVRYELARHFTRYLECQVPGSDSERLTGFAWWLAEAVASVLGTSDTAIAYLMETTIVPRSSNFAMIQQLANPALGPSSIRYATLCLRYMWALCIECQLGPSIEKLRLDLLEPEVREQIGNSIEHSLLQCFPLTETPGEQIVYAFDTTIAPTAHAWAALGERGASYPLAALLQDYRKITDPDELAGAFRSILNEGEGGRLLLGQNIRMMAYTGNLPTDRIWECLQDEQWRRDVWLGLDPVVMELLFDAFSKIQAQQNDKWTTHLPHILAMACEAASGDKERQELLFAYVVASSVQTGTASALERLLRGPHQDEFSEYVQTWRERLLSFMKLAPGWAAGKMRATLASLYVAE